MKYKVYFCMDGDVDVEADSEEEARMKVYAMDSRELAGQTYCVSPEIDDVKQID